MEISFFYLHHQTSKGTKMVILGKNAKNKSPFFNFRSNIWLDKNWQDKEEKINCCPNIEHLPFSFFPYNIAFYSSVKLFVIETIFFSIRNFQSIEVLNLIFIEKLPFYFVFVRQKKTGFLAQFKIRDTSFMMCPFVQLSCQCLWIQNY